MELDAAALIGRRLGSYQIQYLLGSGGMGAVYYATDVTLQRQVALKLIHPGLLKNAQYLERFLREARAVARLDHPNIVKIYTAGQDRGLAFLALELVRGGLTAGVDVTLFRRTVVDALERIIDAHPRRRVAVVCHGGVVNAWAAHVLGLETTLFFQPDYTSVSRFLAAGSGERSVGTLNETAHLRAGG